MEMCKDYELYRYCRSSRKISNKAMEAVPDPNLLPCSFECKDPPVRKGRVEFEGPRANSSLSALCVVARGR